MRRGAGVVGVLVLVAALVRLAAAPSEAHEGNYPIVLIPGWHGDPSTFDDLIPALEAQGLVVLDFDPDRPGAQAMRYGPTGPGQHISHLAGMIVDDEIEAALARNGYEPGVQPIDIVGHSLGGLLGRFLVEQPGADVDGWSDRGWTGDGVADVAPDWAARVDDLVMLGTPSHGTWEAWVPGVVGGFGDRNPSGGDMQPGSTFLHRMGTVAPAGEHYTCVGGDPWYLRWLNQDNDGDDVGHGFDGVVPAESVFMEGCDSSIVEAHHGELLTADAPLDLVVQALGYTSVVDGAGTADLAGTATVRLELADIVADHDWGTKDEYRFDVWIDADGGNNGYGLVDTLSWDADGPVRQEWGNRGPQAAGVTLPGSSPRMDVKLVVWEDDIFDARQPVSTVYFTDLMLSDDLDGMDYYEATAPDSEGGINTFQLSVNGVTSDPGKTRLVTIGVDRAFVDDELDAWGAGEIELRVVAGREGFAGVVQRDSHYARTGGAWIDVGGDRRDDGVVEPEVVWTGRMLDTATWRLEVELVDADGFWSGADSGGRYQWSGTVASLPSGRTDVAGTHLGAWDVYAFVTAGDT